MSRCLHRAAVILATVLALASSRAGAQVSGRVVDAREQPVPEARVELWSARQRLAVARTGPYGAFGFAAEAAEGATGVVASRVGYGPAQASVRPPLSGLVLRLGDGAVAMGAITAASSPRAACPNREDPGARALWEEAAARYSHATDTLAVEANTWGFRGDVAFADLGDVPEGRALYRGYVGTGAYRRAAGPKYGYGLRLTAGSDERFAGWMYADLAFSPQHFIDPSFGELHTLSIRARAPGRTVLAFCPRGMSRGAVVLEGTLALSADRSLLEAEWRFRAPEPKEEAGGEVVFAPRAAGDTAGWLVPASSLYWRKLLGRSSLYFQEMERYGRWRINPRAPLRWTAPPEPEGLLGIRISALH